MITYVLDTNILLHDPTALSSFGNNLIVLPDAVLEELDGKKKEKGLLGANAREAVRRIEEIRRSNPGRSLTAPCEMENGGLFQVLVGLESKKVPECWQHGGDGRVLTTAAFLSEQAEDGEVQIISNDTMMRLKASALGIPAEILLSESAPHEEDQYTGRRSITVGFEDWEVLMKEGSLALPDEVWDEDEEPLYSDDFCENEFLTVSSAGSTSSVLAVFSAGTIEIIPKCLREYHPYGLRPRNAGQTFLLSALARDAEDAPLVCCAGPAGTGKTLLCVAAGLQQVDQGKYERILYLRANQKLDDEIGYLPGTEEEKMNWALRPVKDSLSVIYGNRLKEKDPEKRHEQLQEKIRQVFETDTISIEAVAHMRGRSIADTFVVIDEAQNLTPRQLKTLLSRTTSTSKVVLLGDPQQVDKPFLDSRTNGLSVVSDKLKNSRLSWNITMLPSECERSELALEIITKI